MKITVTQKDIDNGIKENSYSCPMALAFKRNNTSTLLYNSY